MTIQILFLSNYYLCHMARSVEFNEKEAIEKAMDVFWKKGYNGASMRELTDAMGINSSSLYNTIGDKHELFVRCIKNYTEARMAEAVKSADGNKSPLKTIIAFINASVNTIIYGKNSCLAIKTTFEIANNDQSIQAILKADNDFTNSLILSLIKKAMEKGEINKDIDAEMLTDFIVSSFTGWHESFIINQDQKRIKKMEKFLISQISAQ
ncbi:TetR/AcrR family transcriptional regulator [Chryseobacterium sp. PBS4-4]|uniref:TetR/AcrR family transcriptional regulator n=1 Tax=Chryseobacterium edaphi TaxID=2976532 RepID=A0ABT2W4G7_9FLAO|nr:TetR/AcrR family transcriptional regulator [Chryseobacterium edaphi]MCU7616234.1 TetR/AcrR family transcriptional regulator [Chryseobacterium edaphi]